MTSALREASLPSVVRMLLLAAVVSLCLVLSTGGVGAQLVDDHGNFVNTATTLLLGSPIAGRISPGDDLDVFRLDLSRAFGATDVWIYTTGDFDTLGGLYDGNGEPIIFNDDSFIEGTGINFHLRRNLSAGIYYVGVSSGDATTGDYTLHAQAVTDPGSATGTATRLNLDSPTPGTIDTTGDADYFRLDFTESTNLLLYVTNLILSDANYNPLPIAFLNGQVFDSTGSEISANIYHDLIGFWIKDGFGPGTYYIKVTTPPVVTSHPVPYTIYAIEDTDYTQFIDVCQRATDSLNNPLNNDPLYGCQWHLNNSNGEDVNVEAVWAEGISGEGVNITVVDDGMDYTHADLRDNIDTSRNHDYTGSGDIHHPLEHHGTKVAGVIAARDNGIGVRGVAPRATVYGYNFLAAETTDLNSADAMARNGDVTAVSNNSWGPRGGPDLGHASSFWELAVSAGVTDGYGGRGTFYAFAGGSNHLEGDNSNLSELANYYAVTAVCAVNDHDTRSFYSEMGANLWVCAPSNGLQDYRGIVTTENSDRYNEGFGGTSAATPIVSGVAALMRSANPDLTWRDLKLILAASARKNDAGNSGWEDGAGMYGSDSVSDRYHFNHEYGFGVVDAKSAVDLAKGWRNLPPLGNSTAESSQLDVRIPDAPITGDPATVTRTLTVGTGIEFTEFVEVTVSFQHESFRDMEIELESPSGNVSKLAVPFDTLDDDDPSLDVVPLRGTFRFGSARHLGENPNGVWKLRVTDRLVYFDGKLDSWSIKVYGHGHRLDPPTMDSATAGPGSLTVTWTAPRQTAGQAVTAYDLRHVQTAVDETVESNWTVVEDIWTAVTGGALEYTIATLVGGAQYDVQVRAVSGSSTGPWSTTVTGTPTRVTTSDCATGTAVIDAINNPGLVSDCNALLAARDSLVGGAPLNWSENTPIADWDGVTVGGTPRRVTALDLSQNRLTGPMPTELGSLANLQWLSLWGNQLTGPVPAWLGGLVNLEWLYLDENQLTGPIPTELGHLANLQRLSLSQNQLTGPIPTELGRLANLQQLSLWGNQFTGQIPMELSNLANLVALYLSQNQLSGCIPEGLRDVTDNDLENLDLPFCDVLLSGLAISPGSTTPPFNPYHTDYAVVVGQSQVTVTATIDHNSTLHFLDDNRVEVADADGSLDGHQVDLGLGATTISISVISQDGRATLVYTIRVSRATLPGAPVISVITPGRGSLSISWTAPRETGGANITSYDLRYIESSAPDKADANWFLVDDAWTGGLRSYTITRLTGGTQYDVQVRAVNVVGEGLWSNHASDTVPVNELPVFTESAEATRLVAENSAEATIIGMPIAASDADDSTLTYTLGGSDAALFAIVSGTGQIRVGEATTLDYETKTSYSVDVSAADPYGATATITVIITVTNVEEPGTVTLSAQLQVGVELTASLTDPDGGVTGVEWQWARSSDGSTWIGITEATETAYTPVAADEGNYLRVTARYTDGEGSGKSEEAVTANAVGSTSTTGSVIGDNYDADEDGVISSSEVLQAVRDYFDNKITATDVLAVVRLYFSS